MNRRQKIIVSVTGIFLVLLVLVGLTYAFFLTRIKGNENPTSISVTTADLRLIYDDGSDGVIGGINLIPSDEIYEKQFTVYNDGNANVTYGLYLINVVNTFERKEDIQYTLGCSTDGELECKMNGITTFPSGNFRMVENTIEPGVTHTYTFRFTYKETGTDQSIDMGKELSAKIQIFGKDGEFEYIPYEEETSLAYNILNNARLKKNGTELVSSPKTEIGEPISKTNCTNEKVTFEINHNALEAALETDEEWEIAKTCQGKLQLDKTYELIAYNESYFGDNFTTSPYESVKVLSCDGDIATVETTNEIEVCDYEGELSTTPDDYGTSYYFRGRVVDNFVNFNNMCWRVVRVQGDGSIKLMLEDSGNTCDKISYSGNNGNLTISDTGSIWQYYGIDEFSITVPYEGGEDMYMFEVPNYSKGTLKTKLENWLDTKITDNNKKLIKKENWCIGDLRGYDENGNLLGKLPDTYEQLVKNNGDPYTTYYFHNSFSEPTLICKTSGQDGETVSSKIGFITVNEAKFAGAASSSSISYLSYLEDSGYYGYLYTLSPSKTKGNTSLTLYVLSGSGIEEMYSYEFNSKVPSVRPMITLRFGVTLSQDSGDGTKVRPYVIAS